MLSHQKKISEQRKKNHADADMFGKWYEDIDTSLQNAVVKKINYVTAQKIIEDYEWIGTMPLPKSCRYIYGIYFEGCLGGVEVFVEPSTRQFNEKHPRKVVQLNRGACAYWTRKNTASYMLAECFKQLKKEGVIAIIAYCTIEAGEFGTIYRACGFKYTGETKPSKTYYLDKHWVSERTLADKKKWAKSKGIGWVNKFNNLESKMLQAKLRFLKQIGTHKENKEFKKHYGYEFLKQPMRGVEGVQSDTNRTEVVSTLSSLQFADTIIRHESERNS
tara:strand:+ start:56 stop:880 length:825 start_codon:yes stop_codon:yes gene_type:complete